MDWKSNNGNSNVGVAEKKLISFFSKKKWTRKGINVPKGQNKNRKQIKKV